MVGGFGIFSPRVGMKSAGGCGKAEHQVIVKI